MYEHIVERGQYAVVNDDEQTTTPMGRPLVLDDEAVAQEITNDLNTYGTDPSEAISMYTCVCSYLDFLRGRDRSPVVTTAVNDALDDAIHYISADPEFLQLQYPGYTHPVFEENGIRCGLNQQKDVSEKVDWLRHRLEEGTDHQLMTVVMSGANFGSPLLGYAVTDQRSDLSSMARALCGPLRQHIVDSAGGFALGGVGGYWPNFVDEDYCASECQGQTGMVLNCSCGVYRSLDVMQRFSRMPD